jgi:hypothetical protein
MEVFFFGSKTLTNIWAGIGAELWAVSESQPQDMQARITKSASMRIGSLGVLYCTEVHSFTTPFVVYSRPDADRVVTDVWPERWRLPFKIHPLGSPHRLLHMDKAKDILPILKNSTVSSVSAALNITGTTVFVSKEISAEDWEIIMQHLAS